MTDPKPISPLVKQILAQRGLTDEAEIERFLYPNYDEHLHDPFLLTDMEPAVRRIIQAVEKAEQIIIYGDYDIDGITASAVMLETIASLGGAATSYIPDRFEEGYGLNLAALKKLKNDGADLVISVDCGITSVKEAAWAKSNGLDLIITDHHTAPEVIPETVAVINPKRPGDEYPFKDLAGVGVAFKLAQALQIRTGKPDKGQEKWLLDVVALGTVCDVVTLVGENRVLAKFGLKVLNQTRRVGLRALAKVSGVEIGQISTYHLGFVFGPRMNAAGRLEHAAQSLELLLTNDPNRAEAIAAELDRLNLKRQADQARITEAASRAAEVLADDPILVVAGTDWSHGIVGIVAAKLTERFHKPALVMQIMGETAKGSARSVGEFNMIEALTAMKGHFSKFGGHHFAAGYTLKTSDIDHLRTDLNDYARSIGLTGPSESTIAYDTQLEALSELSWELLTDLTLLEPFGNANPKPRFKAENLVVREARWVGQSQNHLKLSLIDGLGNGFDGIAFDQLRLHPNLAIGDHLDAVFQLDRNEFNGRVSLQLVINHLIEQS